MALIACAGRHKLNCSSTLVNNMDSEKEMWVTMFSWHENNTDWARIFFILYIRNKLLGQI